VQLGQRPLRQLHPRRAEQRPSLRHAEPQIIRAELGQLSRQPQSMQPQPQIMSGGKHEPQLRRCPQHQELKLGQHFARAEVMRIVDHQPQSVR
jgi:hypothetical protein